jgi:hypothetical protein
MGRACLLPTMLCRFRLYFSAYICGLLDAAIPGSDGGSICRLKCYAPVGLTIPKPSGGVEPLLSNAGLRRVHIKCEEYFPEPSSRTLQAAQKVHRGRFQRQYLSREYRRHSMKGKSARSLTILQVRNRACLHTVAGASRPLRNSQKMLENLYAQHRVVDSPGVERLQPSHGVIFDVPSSNLRCHNFL